MVTKKAQLKEKLFALVAAENGKALGRHLTLSASTELRKRLKRDTSKAIKAGKHAVLITEPAGNATDAQIKRLWKIDHQQKLPPLLVKIVNLVTGEESIEEIEDPRVAYCRQLNETQGFEVKAIPLHSLAHPGECHLPEEEDWEHQFFAVVAGTEKIVIERRQEFCDAERLAQIAADKHGLAWVVPEQVAFPDDSIILERAERGIVMEMEHDGELAVAGRTTGKVHVRRRHYGTCKRLIERTIEQGELTEPLVVVKDEATNTTDNAEFQRLWLEGELVEMTWEPKKSSDSVITKHLSRRGLLKK